METVRKHPWNIYIYILATILCILMTSIESKAGDTSYVEVWALGGRFSNGSTVIGHRNYSENDNSGTGEDILSYPDAPKRTDGAKFLGYIKKRYALTGDNRDYPELWDAIYCYQNDIHKVITYTNHRTFDQKGEYVREYKNDVTIDTKTGVITYSNGYYRTADYLYMSDEIGEFTQWRYDSNFAYYDSGHKDNLEQLLKPTQFDFKYWRYIEHNSLYGSGMPCSINSVAIYSKTLGYNITFNVNGGSASISSQTVSSISLPNPGTRPFYTFEGWYNGNTYVGKAGDKWKPTANTTLTARWYPNLYYNGKVIDRVVYNGNPITQFTYNLKKIFS